MTAKRNLTGQRIDLGEDRYIAVSRTPDGNFQLNAQSKIEDKKWRTCVCKRDENNIVSTVMKISEAGAIALCKLLLDELGKDEKVKINVIFNTKTIRYEQPK
jgi:hypothetical protein